MFQKAVSKKKIGLDKVRAIGETYFSYSQKHPDYFNAMLYYESRNIDFSVENSCAQACEAHGSRSLQIVAEAIQVGIADGSIRSDIDPFKTAVVLWGHSTGIIQVYSLKGAHLEDKHGFDMSGIIELSIEMMARSMKA